MRILEKTAEYLGIFFLALATVLVAFNVTARYVFNYGAPWCEEAIRYSVIFATFFGLSIAIVKNSCMKIDLLIQLTKGQLSHIIKVIGTIVELFMVLAMTYCSYLLVIETCETGQITPSTDYPMWIPYCVVAFGVVICALCAIKSIVRTMKEGN